MHQFPAERGHRAEKGDTKGVQQSHRADSESESESASAERGRPADWVLYGKIPAEGAAQRESSKVSGGIPWSLAEN